MNGTWPPQKNGRHQAAYLGLTLLALSVATAAQTIGPGRTTSVSGTDARLRALEQTVKDLEARVKKLEDEVEIVDEPETPPDRKPTEIGGDERKPGSKKPPEDVSPLRPSRLTAPVEIVDRAGTVLVRFQSAPAGGGQMLILGTGGTPGVIVGIGSNGTAGSMRIADGGKDRLRMGVLNPSGVGAIFTSDGSGQDGAGMFGNGEVLVFGKGGGGYVASLQRNGQSGLGAVVVRDTTGAELVSLTDGGKGAGRVQVWDKTGKEVIVGISTAQSGPHGDVCATGKRVFCLSTAAAKTITPYW